MQSISLAAKINSFTGEPEKKCKEAGLSGIGDLRLTKFL